MSKKLINKLIGDPTMVAQAKPIVHEGDSHSNMGGDLEASSSDERHQRTVFPPGSGFGELLLRSKQERRQIHEEV